MASKKTCIGTEEGVVVTACITEIHCPVACEWCVSPAADNAVSAGRRLPNKVGFAVQSLWQIVARGSSKSIWTWSGGCLLDGEFRHLLHYRSPVP